LKKVEKKVPKGLTRGNPYGVYSPADQIRGRVKKAGGGLNSELLLTLKNMGLHSLIFFLSLKNKIIL
jgi:hypothetical protein